MNFRRVRTASRIRRDTVPLLSVQDLSLEFRTRTGIVRALENVSLEVKKGETVGIVGESGSGKSVLSYAILRILDPAARITRGTVTFGGLDVLAASATRVERVAVRPGPVRTINLGRDSGGAAGGGAAGEDGAGGGGASAA